MRCVDVIRELAAPSDMRDAAAVADHLRDCSSCAAFADHAARLDHLWQATRPSEPAPEVWDNLWSQLALSLDGRTSREVVSSPTFRNGSTSTSSINFEVKVPERSPARSFRSRPWVRIALVRVSLAAAALLIACLSWSFLVPAKQDVALLKPATPNPAEPRVRLVSLPSVDIEAGHTVVILADPNSPSVVDRTPKGMTADVDYAYVDWYGDERYFDWPQVFNEVESLAKPQVAMKE
jgi:hypothetical protein